MLRPERVVCQSDRVTPQSLLLSRLELLPAAATTLDCLPASTGLTQKPARRRLVCLACTTCSLTVSLLLTSTLLTLLLLFCQRSLLHCRCGVVLSSTLRSQCRASRKPRPQHTPTPTRQTHFCIFRNTTLCFLRPSFPLADSHDVPTPIQHRHTLPCSVRATTFTLYISGRHLCSETHLFFPTTFVLAKQEPAWRRTYSANVQSTPT